MESSETPVNASNDGLAQPSEAPKFRIGDLVWYKIKGYPYWPAKILNPDDPNQPAKGRKMDCHVIRFFESKDYFYVPIKEEGMKLLALDEYWSQHAGQTQKNKTLKKAIEYADKARKLRQTGLRPDYDSGLDDLPLPSNSSPAGVPESQKNRKRLSSATPDASDTTPKKVKKTPKDGITDPKPQTPRSTSNQSKTLKSMFQATPGKQKGSSDGTNSSSRREKTLESIVPAWANKRQFVEDLKSGKIVRSQTDIQKITLILKEAEELRKKKEGTSEIKNLLCELLSSDIDVHILQGAPVGTLLKNLKDHESKTVRYLRKLLKNHLIGVVEKSSAYLDASTSRPEKIQTVSLDTENEGDNFANLMPADSQEHLPTGSPSPLSSPASKGVELQHAVDLQADDEISPASPAAAQEKGSMDEQVEERQQTQELPQELKKEAQHDQHFSLLSENTISSTLSTVLERPDHALDSTTDTETTSFTKSEDATTAISSTPSHFTAASNLATVSELVSSSTENQMMIDDAVDDTDLVSGDVATPTLERSNLQSVSSAPPQHLT